MHASLLTPSKYIKSAALLAGDKTVTITGVKLEELERDDKTKEVKGMISLAETPKKWVLNVTNVKCLVVLFGNETDSWLGKKVTLFAEPNDMSESGYAIRVRGSPEISKDVTFTLKLARKKPRKVTLKRTAPGNGAGKPANGNGQAAAPEPAADDSAFDEPADEQDDAHDDIPGDEAGAGDLEPTSDGQRL